MSVKHDEREIKDYKAIGRRRMSKSPKDIDNQRGVDNPEEAAEGSVRAVDRAIAILNAFSVDQPSMSVIEIQKKVGLSRPTLYRLLSTLVAARLVRGEGDPQRFRLDHGVMNLANVWLSTLDVVDVARSLIEELRDSTGETAGLFLLRDHTRLCALECKSREVISYSRGMGNAGDISQGATGKAILAALNDHEVESALDAMKLKGDKRASIKTSVADTRERGYAISFSEIIEGAVAIAAPFYDYHGAVAGSVGLFGPQARFSEEKIKAAAGNVISTAASLSERLGHSAMQAAVPLHKKSKTREDAKR